MNLDEFAASKKVALQDGEDFLFNSVKLAIRRQGKDKWEHGLAMRVQRLIRREYHTLTGHWTSKVLRVMVDDLDDDVHRALARLTPDLDHIDTQARATATSLASAALSVATLAAAKDSDEEEPLGKVWVSMEDDRVRVAHIEAHGQIVPLNENFTVGGVKMSRPGDIKAPIELWINCRCVLGIQPLGASSLGPEMALWTSFTQGADMPDEITDVEELDDDLTVPWHGVLAPEGVMSGDKRKFAPDSLRWRDLPLPLAWQKVNAQGHDGSVVVGRIDEIWRDEGLLRARGVMLSTPEADEAVGLLAEEGIRGVSVDVDDATMALEDEDGNVVDDLEGLFSDKTSMIVTDGRICGATLCAIPAFMEAHVYLGAEPEESLAAAGVECVPCQYKAGIDEGSWDGSSSHYSDQEWYDATLIHLESGAEKLVKSNNKLPIYTPSGKLSRAGTHAAAGRIGQTDAPPDKISSAKSALRGAYRVLGDEIPDSLKAAVEEFESFDLLEEFVKTEDGPGWLTHPVDTERLRRYWTKGKGALKIRWGVPGDFNRCRLQLAKYIKPQYLSGYCANRHYDALGFWPGRPVSGDTTDFSGPSLNLVASAFDVRPPKAWFEDPHLAGGSPIVVTDDGRVFGHLAEWSRCHVGFDQTSCTIAPGSPSNYAFFNTGYVKTDEGDVSVGHITFNTGHAGGRLNAAAAASHYDNTGTVIADVHAGEDQYGVWVAGWMRPGTTEEDKYVLRSATLSGDWRMVGTDLELVAALAVNVPGFPIPRTELAASGGRQMSLVASGVVEREVVVQSTGLDEKAFARAVVREMEMIERRKKMHALKADAHRDPASRMAELRDKTRSTV